ncbi:MAG: ASCH domain-containing protein [Halohasta sp.]
MAEIDAADLLPSEGIRQAVLAGEVTQLHRGNQYADAGDRFVIDGMTFEVTTVETERLGELTDEDARAEGSPNLAAYKERIEQTHDTEWDDDTEVVLHEFEPVDG